MATRSSRFRYPFGTGYLLVVLIHGLGFGLLRIACAPPVATFQGPIRGQKRYQGKRNRSSKACAWGARRPPSGSAWKLMPQWPRQLWCPGFLDRFSALSPRLRVKTRAGHDYRGACCDWYKSHGLLGLRQSRLGGGGAGGFISAYDRIVNGPFAAETGSRRRGWCPGRGF